MTMEGSNKLQKTTAAFDRENQPSIKILKYVHVGVDIVKSNLVVSPK
jgi:hypothetical protein